MKLVTDPELLSKLESNDTSSGKEVTDPELLRQLNGESAQVQNDGVGSKVLDFVMRGGGIPGNPIDVAQRVYKGVTKAFDKGGEMTAEKLGKNGVDPRIAAGVGTTVAMVPDLATMAVPGGTGIRGEKAIKSAAEGWAMRALGFPKSQLKTPFARGQAAKAARVALDEGIISGTGNVLDTITRAKNLQESSGQSIGKIRDSVGSQPVDEIFNSLESLRSKLVQGRKGGVWDDISRKIDNAQESILGLLNKNNEVPLKDVVDTKNILGKSVNYNSDLASQENTKAITKAIESGIENTMKGKGVDMTRYAKEKERFGAAKKMLEGLDVIGSQIGNNRYGPTAAGGGILATATQGPLSGLLSLLGIDFAKKRGPSLAANALNKIASQAEGRAAFSSPLRNLILQLVSRQANSRQ